MIFYFFFFDPANWKEPQGSISQLGMASGEDVPDILFLKCIYIYILIYKIMKNIILRWRDNNDDVALTDIAK